MTLLLNSALVSTTHQVNICAISSGKSSRTNTTKYEKSRMRFPIPNRKEALSLAEFVCKLLNRVDLRWNGNQATFFHQLPSPV
jgi:hypothetical protein